MAPPGCHKPGCMEESQKGQVSVTSGEQPAGCCSGAQSIGRGLISPFSLSHLLSRTEIVGLWRSPHPERAFIQAHPLLHRPRQDRSVSHSDVGSDQQPPLRDRVYPGPVAPHALQGPGGAGNAAMGDLFPLLAAASQPCSQDFLPCLAPSLPSSRCLVPRHCWLAGKSHPCFMHRELRAQLWVRPLSLSCKQQIPTESLELVQSK